MLDPAAPRFLARAQLLRQRRRGSEEGAFGPAAKPSGGFRSQHEQYVIRNPQHLAIGGQGKGQRVGGVRSRRWWTQFLIDIRDPKRRLPGRVQERRRWVGWDSDGLPVRLMSICCISWGSGGRPPPARISRAHILESSPPVVERVERLRPQGATPPRRSHGLEPALKVGSRPGQDVGQSCCRLLRRAGSPSMIGRRHRRDCDLDVVQPRMPGRSTFTIKLAIALHDLDQWREDSSHSSSLLSSKSEYRHMLGPARQVD